MPDFTNFLQPPPPQHPPSPATVPLISCPVLDAVDPNAKPVSKFSSRDPEPQLKPDLQCNELDAELNYKSDSTIEHQDSDLSSEPELRVVHRVDELKCQSNGENRVRVCQRDVMRLATGNKSLDEFVKDWVKRRVNAGVPEQRCFLPFLLQAPKLVKFIFFFRVINCCFWIVVFPWNFEEKWLLLCSNNLV